MITPSRKAAAILDSPIRGRSERGYEQVFVEDATTSVSDGAHLFEHRMLD